MATPSPLEQVAEAIRKAVAGAIEDEKATLIKIAEAAKPGASSSSGDGSTALATVLAALLSIVSILDPPAEIAVQVVNGVAGQESGDSGGFGIGYYLGSTVLELVEPYMRYITHQIEAAAESMIFDPALAADLSARGIITTQFGASEATGGGFDRPHFDWMVTAAQNHPDLSQALTLWNLGQLNTTDLQLIFQRHGYDQQYWPGFEQLARNYLSPADLALASLRGILDPTDAQSYAELLGVTNDDFQTIIGNTGEPPGLMTLLEMYRRNIIDKPTLERGIKQSRYRDEWIPAIEAVRYAPMSVAEAANAVTRGYMDEPTGAAIADQNGLIDDQWPIILLSNGRPLSAQQMLGLYRRGIVTLDQVKDAVRQSDIKDSYVDWAADLGLKLPALYETVNLLKAGDLTAETATKILLEDGYDSDTVTEIVAGAGKQVKTTHKALTAANFLTMYADGLVDNGTTVKNLTSLGYSDSDANWLIVIEDAKTQAAAIRGEVALVRQQYERHQIDETVALQKMVALGVDAGKAQSQIQIWGTTRLASQKMLTEAQVVKSLKEGVISADDALTRLRALGYSDNDAYILMKVYGDYSPPTFGQ